MRGTPAISAARTPGAFFHLRVLLLTLRCTPACISLKMLPSYSSAIVLISLFDCTNNRPLAPSLHITVEVTEHGGLEFPLSIRHLRMRIKSLRNHADTTLEIVHTRQRLGEDADIVLNLIVAMLR